jgi:hypothetical protein
MPNDLRQAHIALDNVVDSLYSSKKFVSDDERLDCLFQLYKKITKGEK